MGLLDGLFNPSADQAGLLPLVGLLGARQGDNSLMHALMSSAQLSVQARKQQRDDRANELQQLTATYKILKDQDSQARNEAMFSGQPPPPQNPLLAQHEARLAQLMGQPGLPGMSAAPPQQVPQRQQAPQAPQIPAAQASQTSPVVNPEFRNPQVVSAVQQAQAPQQPPPTLPEMLKGAGIPPALAAQWASTPQGQNQLFKHLAEVYGPRVVNNVMMQLSPNGSTRMLGGMMGQDSLPVGIGLDGKPQIQPIAGATDYFAGRAGAVTRATEEAKAPFSFSSYPIGPNGGAQVASIRELMRREGGGPPQQSSGVATVTAQPPRPGNAYAPGGGGLTGADPVRVAGDTAQSSDMGKFYAQTFIDTQMADKAATNSRYKLDRFSQLLSGIETGKMTPTSMTVAAYAKDLIPGLNIDTKKLNALQAAQSISSELALQNRNPSGGAGMPGALSDSDLKFLKTTVPGLEQTAEGRALIVDTKRKLLQRDNEVAQLARDYRKKNKMIDDGFYQVLADYANAHPLFPQSQAQGNPAIDDLVKKYTTPQ